MVTSPVVKTPVLPGHLAAVSIALILTMAVVVRAETIQTPAPMCAIDMGSNSFRRIVGSFEKGRYAQRNIEVMTLGVGDDLARHGRISDPKLAEVAEALGIPLKTVWTRLFYARRDFAVAIKEDEGHG